MIQTRCIYCLKVVRKNNTCQNPECPLYEPETTTENGSEATEDNGSDTTTEQP